MVKVMRITRHEASEAQLEELRRIYGDVEVTTISETLPSNSREFTARFDELTEGYKICEAVLPLNLMEAVLRFTSFSKEGGQLIRAVMNREVDDEGNASFTFSHYERIDKVEIVSTRL